MFYRNALKTKKTQSKTFEFDMFSSPAQTGKDDSVCDFNLTDECYNFRTNSGALVGGYGFEDFASPLSKTDLENESTVAISGNEISALWSFEWYDKANDENKYYSMYFNDQMKICYDDMFGARPTTLLVNTSFTVAPVGIRYKLDGIDSMIFSGKGQNLLVLKGQSQLTSENVPRLISICSHFGKLFAITAEARGRLVYTDNENILEWSDEQTKNLDFSDSRGNLTKIVSFDDYVYIFREYGITRISEYSSDSEFAITHLYQSDSYIYPNSIAHSGDRIYFLEKSGLKYFNGSSVRSVEANEVKNLSLVNNNCYGQCFEGKYFLACKMDFQEGQVGCETSSFTNNALLVYDEADEHCEVVRGIDIRSMLALQNPYKPKLIACFYGENKAKLGQLTEEGKAFSLLLPAKWQSVKSDLGQAGKRKKIKKILIKSLSDCTLTIKSDEEEKSFALAGQNKLQELSCNVVGKEFAVLLSSQSGPSTKISSLVLSGIVEN